MPIRIFFHCTISSTSSRRQRGCGLDLKREEVGEASETSCSCTTFLYHTKTYDKKDS